MSNGIKIAIGLIGLALITFLGVVSMQPDSTHVERSVVLASTPADTFPFANNFDKWLLWNPWQGLDPSQKNTFSESREGPGAWYTWEGNKDVGRGKMTIKSTKPPE
ncbi:MAG TPA: polyketide cyclase, partial [Myxococcota bacterium]|nr:polyketide cyclase [Myxococcota bacterium]